MMHSINETSLNSQMRWLSVSLVSAFLLLFVVKSPGFAFSDGYQQSFRHTNTHPFENESTGFSQLTNGIAHDNEYWYITNNHYEHKEALWKIPVGKDLDGISATTPGVVVLLSDQIICPTVWGDKNIRDDLGYIHFGDLDAFQPNSNGPFYLVIPLENGSPGPAIAVLRADNFQCVAFDVVKTNNNEPPTVSDAAAWCAVDPAGYIYTSPNWWNFDGEEQSILLKYSLPWDKLGGQEVVKLTFDGAIPLLDDDGTYLESWEIAGWAQGGEFSEDGKLLYVSSGSGGEDRDYGGIHVFDTSTWKRIARSHNDSNETFFKYDWGEGCEEPEGLTVWDLEAGRDSYTALRRAPNTDGQLHVILLCDSWLDADDVFIYHYTNTIYVDQNYSGIDTPDGRITRPLKKVGDAISYYNQNELFNFGHWTGGTIKVQTGFYPEAMTLSRRMEILPWSATSTAVIGAAQ